MKKTLCITSITLGLLAGTGSSLVLAAGTEAAPTVYQPESPLYSLSTGWSAALFFAAALGVLLGLGGRRWFNVYRSRVAPGQVLRHRAMHAVLHWLNALGFVLALASGAMLLKWIGSIGELNAYRVHFLGGALILFAIGAVSVRALVYEPGRHPIRITRSDLAELRHELLAYLGLEGSRGLLGYSSPKAPAHREGKAVLPEGEVREKYLATERVISYPLWIIISGVLMVTGVIKALRYVTGMPDSLLGAATRLHDWAAWAVLAMLVLHAGAVIIIKTNWPLLKSMFTLTVPEKFGEEE